MEKKQLRLCLKLGGFRRVTDGASVLLRSDRSLQPPSAPRESTPAEHSASPIVSPFDPGLAAWPLRVLPVVEVRDLLPITHAATRVQEYLQAMTRGERFPPISVIRLAGRFVVADGHKRFTAYKLLTTAPILVEVWPMRRWLEDQWRQFLDNLEKNRRILSSVRTDPATAARLFAATAGHWRRVALCLLRRHRAAR